MKFSLITLLAYGASVVVAAPQIQRDTNSLSQREASIDLIHSLEKRKGGGGGGGKGGSSGSSGGSSSGSRSGSGSSSGSSGSSGSGSARSGSGTSYSYGNKYTGGASTPYKAGGSSPARKIAPYAIGGAAVGGFGAYYATPWIYPVWGYHYPIYYSWNANGRNNTANVTCLCQAYQPCGCDPDGDSTFLNQVVANGTNGPPINSTNVRSVIFNNGTALTYINGSLANGTTAPSNGAVGKMATAYGGYSLMVATVVVGVLLL